MPKSHAPLALIIHEACISCIRDCVHGFVHVHMNILIVTHAWLQPLVMSLFYSGTSYEVQIVWGFGDHQHNWQRHNECFSISPHSSGECAAAKRFRCFVFRIELRTNEQIYRQIKSLNCDLFLHFKVIPLIFFILHMWSEEKQAKGAVEG